MLLGYYCRSKCSGKQERQDSIYFLHLDCAINTYNMAAATLNIDST